MVNVLIWLNIAFFFVELQLGEGFILDWALWPLGNPSFEVWQFLTYSFIHANVLHLFFNLLALWMFGRPVEEKLGSVKFLVLYLVSVLTAALVQTAYANAIGVTDMPSVGASGAVFGVLLAFGVFFAKEWVIFIFPPIPMRAWLFVLIYAGLELFLGLSGIATGVAHFAHLGGALGALVLISWWKITSTV